MGFAAWLEDVGDGERAKAFDALRSEIGVAWVTEALKRTGKQTIRRRLLTNEAVVWLVIGMSLFRDIAIEGVAKHLGLIRREEETGRRSPTGSRVGGDTTAKARQRVGVRPLEVLFRLLADAWSEEVQGTGLWRGLNLLAVDGSTVSIADTPENDVVYGRPGSSRSTAAYPQVRVLGLLSIGSRLLLDFVVGMLAQSEQELAALLWDKLPNHSLVILDRGFVNYANFYRIPSSGTNRHWLCRGKSKLSFKVVKNFGAGDSLVELTISSRQRKLDPELPATIQVRLVEFQLKGFRGTYRLLTSMVDPAEVSVQELISLYHERWQVETAYSEVKVRMLHRRETIRSKTPEGVWQELLGLAIAYNLVRVMMARAAKTADLPPYRLSFHNSLLHVRSFLLAAPEIAPGNLPRLYAKLAGELAILVLPEQRERSYPRQVKKKMSNYKRKTIPGHSTGS